MNLIQVNAVALSRSKVGAWSGASLDIRKDDMHGFKVGTICNDGTFHFKDNVKFTPAAMMQLISMCAALVKLNNPQNLLDKPPNS